MNPLEAASGILVSFQGISNVVRKQRRWESRRAQVNAKADLGHHRNGFKDTLEVMLGPFVDKESDLEELCGDPGLSKWKALGLDVALQQVYQRRYELIQDNLESLSVILEDIQSCLEEVSIILKNVQKLSPLQNLFNFQESRANKFSTDIAR